MKVLIFREQISGCNDHVNALMRLYANVANRGDVTKEMIFNALHNGFYSVKIIPKMGKTGKSENLGNTEEMEAFIKEADLINLEFPYSKSYQFYQFCLLIEIFVSFGICYNFWQFWTFGD
jgi:hypothetical protein